jgi:hypothetical protein
MKQALSGLVLVLLLAVFGHTATAASQKRVALVIGNGAYLHAQKLPNPANDARDVATLLRALDFDVIEAVDLTRDRFIDTVGTFLEKAASAPAALLYYGGHGVQYAEDNYLLAVDAKLDSLYALKSEAFSLKEILGELETVSAINLVFLDACRDNPLAEALSRTIKTRSGTTPISRGLARVAPGGSNTLIAFAATPGNVALDGTGRNSPFTAAFLKNVQASNDDVMILFKSIIRDVQAATSGQQNPQMVSGLTVDFSFHGDTSINVNGAPSLSEAQLAYDAAVKIGTEKAFQTIVESYPGSVHAKLAAAAIAALPKPAPAPATAPAPAPTVKAPLAPPQTGTNVAALAPEAIEEEMKLSRAQIREVQFALQKLGYKTGNDGTVFGSLTRDAIARYQAAVGIQASGHATPTLLASLGIPFGEAAAERPLGDARQYTVASLGPGADPRLVKAVGALAGKEIRFGTFEGHLYVAVLAWGINWPAARALSEAAGGHLLTIGSKAENDFVFSLFSSDDRFVKLEPDGVSLSGPWFGLFQAVGGREPAGGWQWVTGEPFKYKNWSMYAPDNWRAGENYGRFWGALKKDPSLKQPIWWDDARETDEFRGLIIEID